MTYTLEELKEKLIRFDEIILLELLEISSEEIINRFEDLIELNYEKLSKEVED